MSIYLKPIYLDYMATTPVDPRVTEKMLPYLLQESGFGNPSSKHFYGYQTKDAIELARAQVADLFNTESSSIFWTSGATEANNLAIKGAVLFYQRQGKHIITCQTEHKSILDTCRYLTTQGFDITYLKPNTDGLLDLNHLEQAIRSDTILISIMHVNNEIGVIQDIAKIGEITSKHGILFHVDAAQSAGKIPIDLKDLKIDLMSISAHKIYGPKGVGALYVRQQPTKLHLVPQIHGGEQQNGMRSGTLPTHQIAGMGEALSIAKQEMLTEDIRLLNLRTKLWEGIKNLPNIQLNGSLNNRINNNLNISFTDIDGEILLAALTNLALSSGSTCINGQSSYVLKALGVDHKTILNTLRISIGRFTTEDEIDFTINELCAIVNRLH